MNKQFQPFNDIDTFPKPYEGMGCAIWLFIIGMACALATLGFVIYGWFNN